ncbi:MAG: hypothetical protein SFW35_12305 [Chitinophagales bacterium]|nr:hypothetical protein [Chitinophagales bacterium]
MKNIYLLLQIAFWSHTAYGQIPNFNSRDTVACTYDTMQQIIVPTHWEIYQTYDDTWNGPRDTNFCPSISNTSSYYIGLPVNQLNRTVFLRALFNGVQLSPNDVYGLNASINLLGQNIVNYADTGSSCPEMVCTGMLAAVQIPDSFGTGTDMRWHEVNYYNGSWTGNNLNGCIPTEYFPDQLLKEVIYKVTFSNIPTGDTILFTPPYLEQVWYLNTINALYASQIRNGRHVVDLFDPINLVLHDNTYPSPTNWHYVEVSPNPNVAYVDTIDIFLQGGFEENVLLFQPFTELIGGHPVNDSINRHVVNIVNQGANFCFSYLVEKGFENGGNYIHQSGKLSFDYHRGCMFFGKGSSLVVADGAKLEYGTATKGMLALKTGGSIEIGKGAELLMKGKISLMEYEWEGPQQIYMTLNPGAKLTFAKGSRITNEKSKYGTIKLNVYMKGGVLDDSHLSPASRALINKIYDVPKENVEENLKLLGNPIYETLRLSYTAAEKETLLFSYYDLQGKYLGDYTAKCQQGINYIDIPVGNLPAGAYILKTTKGQTTSFTQKFVKL